MQWEWIQWRRQWLNWVALPCIFVFLVFSYGNLRQTNDMHIEKELTLLADEQQQLLQLEDELAQRQSKTSDKQIKTVRAQRRRVQQYATALEQRERGLASARLAYFRGIRTKTLPLSERKDDVVTKAIVRDTYLVQKGLVAEEIRKRPTPARFLITIQNRTTFIGLLLIIVMQISSVFSSDWEKGRHRLLYTLPRPRWHLLARKTAFAGAVAMADMVITLGAAYFLAAINAGGNSGWAYPFVTANHQIVTLGTIFEANCLVMLQLILLSLAFIAGAGLLLRDRFTTTLVLGVGCVAAGILAKVKIAWLPNQFNPLKWLRLTDYWSAGVPMQQGGEGWLTIVFIFILIYVLCYTELKNGYNN